MKINRNYLRLPDNYLFSTIAAKTRAYQAAHPQQALIKLSIGDVSRPLPVPVVKTLQDASAEMGQRATFQGYGPETGYPWLKAAIRDYYQTTKGVTLTPDEIIISDGAKSDVANLLDIFDPHCTVAMTDPVYPVYWESNVMVGHKIKLLPATAKNGFLPMPNRHARVDLIYLCNPANPTGVCYTREQLKQWVDFALKHHAVILYDAAYEAFVRDPQLPTSIYQIAGAKQCAIEICSLSKTAGFTGLRCGYTVVPTALIARGVSLNRLWQRRQTAKFNGVSYLVQRAAAAVFSPTGWTAIQRNLRYYQRNTTLITQTLDSLNWSYVGGVHSPYVWVRCPKGQTAWQFFDYLLSHAGIICPPGVGFGKAGEHYVRLTGFNTYAQTRRACQLLNKVLTQFKQNI